MKIKVVLEIEVDRRSFASDYHVSPTEAESMILTDLRDHDRWVGHVERYNGGGFATLVDVTVSRE